MSPHLLAQTSVLMSIALFVSLRITTDNTTECKNNGMFYSTLSAPSRMLRFCQLVAVKGTQRPVDLAESHAAQPILTSSQKIVI